MSRPERLSMGDNLALDRTYLANERTLLAYARSAFAMFLAGITFLKIFEHEPLFQLVGWILLGLSPSVFVFGLYRTYKMNAQIHNYYQ